MKLSPRKNFVFLGHSACKPQFIAFNMAGIIGEVLRYIRHDMATTNAT